jgi:predicted transcriptional regulator of viral defense system
MNQVEAFRRLKSLGDRGFETRDAAAVLQVKPGNAHMILSRLARGGLLTHVSRGRWLLSETGGGFILAELIAAPFPAYISLQSALFHHGMIDQVPAVIYAITLGRPRRVDTGRGVVSFHRMPPELFAGFEVAADGAKIASAEKALFDTLYLAPGRSRLFAKLPELEISRGFRWQQLRRYANAVKSSSRRSFLATKIEGLRAESTARSRPRRQR